MNKILILAKKEIDSYFNSPLGYVVASVFLIVSGWLFMQGFFIAGQASMRSFFNLLPILFVFILPAITMSLWSEEKRSGTIEVLMSFPIRAIEAVLGKFLSCFAFLFLMLAFTLFIPYMVSSLGDPDKGIIFAGYVGALLLGSSYIAIGLWISSITKNQIISFIITIVIIFSFYAIGNSFIIGSFPSEIASVCKFLSFNTHFNSILRGVISLSDVAYYLSVIVFFLFLNIRVILLKKWD